MQWHHIRGEDHVASETPTMATCSALEVPLPSSALPTSNCQGGRWSPSPKTRGGGGHALMMEKMVGKCENPIFSRFLHLAPAIVLIFVTPPPLPHRKPLGHEGPNILVHPLTQISAEPTRCEQGARLYVDRMIPAPQPDGATSHT